jgi:iron(II)-dependent oxidoreductase
MEQAGILHFIVQEHARTYEQMLSLKLLIRLSVAQATPHKVWQVLESRLPAPHCVDVDQGAYRIGSRADEPAAFDNELPPQVIELGGYRIATQPVTNAEYLAFMEAGGYQNDDLWDEAGLAWRRAECSGAPLHWRQDEQGHWYGLGISGAADLVPSDPVQGLSQYEALAFAAWASALEGPCQGAVLPHEFQWEAAIRTRAIPADARVWEWCANTFGPYRDYQAPAHSLYATPDFDGNQVSLRGGCLHTQPALRRPAYRHRGRPHWNQLFAGCRLVLPPTPKAWEKV